MANETVQIQPPAPKADVGQDLLQVPFAEMVKSMATGIAEAQFELDMTSLKIAQVMGGTAKRTLLSTGKTKQKNNQGKKPGGTGYQELTDADYEEVDCTVDFDGEKYSLLELGFTPTFYQFVDTIIEVKMSISMSSQSSSSRKSGSFNSSASASGSAGFFSARGEAKLNASSVSASFASKFQYSAEGASLMRTKLVPVPPPTVLEERVRAIADRRAAAKSQSTA